MPKSIQRPANTKLWVTYPQPPTDVVSDSGTFRLMSKKIVSPWSNSRVAVSKSHPREAQASSTWTEGPNADMDERPVYVECERTPELAAGPGYCLGRVCTCSG